MSRFCLILGEIILGTVMLLASISLATYRVTGWWFMDLIGVMLWGMAVNLYEGGNCGKTEGTVKGKPFGDFDGEL